MRSAFAPTVALAASLFVTPLIASPLDPAARAALAAGAPATVIVEFDYQPPAGSSIGQRVAAFRAYKARLNSLLTGTGARPVRDLPHMALALWQVGSLPVLTRLEGLPGIKYVHQDGTLHPVSTSDLAFIDQPQAQASGGTGAGTTIAVIDGGLGSNYTQADFGPCTAIATPASCRVVYNTDFYTNSSEVTHGTNVSAIAIDVAAKASLAMFDVFNGTQASFSDVITAMDDAIQMQSTYNIVAINLSLGDSTSNATPCTSSAFVPAVQSANAAGISVVAAAGNSGSKSGIGAPACTPGIIAVGAVYDASYGTIGWQASADSGGTCTDTSAADLVTCFSQSASYLAMLAPGTFVSAPSAAFVESGTSQASPHIAGAVAVLRARYAAESLAESLQRLQSTGPVLTDPANGISTHRLDLAAAFDLGTSLSLSGTGSSTATAGTSTTYAVTVTNNGPLTATDVVLSDTFPASAQISALPGGCSRSGNTVNCTVASLAVGAASSFSIGVQWSASGSVYDAWHVNADQLNSASASQQTLAFGTAPRDATDAPLPAWGLVLLGLTLLGVAHTRRRAHSML